jgi:hypothetical protein
LEKPFPHNPKRIEQIGNDALDVAAAESTKTARA